MSNAFRLVSKPKNKLISNHKQSFNVTNLLSITFGIILSQSPRGKKWTNSQIDPGSTDKNQKSKIRNY